MSTPSSSPFLAFVTDQTDALNGFVQSKGWQAGCVQAGDIRTAATWLKDNPAPQVLLVEIPNAEEAPPLLDALADVCAPDTKVIVTGTVNEYSFYCWLTDIGIQSYLLKPLTPGALEAAYTKTTAPPSEASKKKEQEPGRLIAVMGARGGVGGSTMAVNLAWILAEEQHCNTALLDLDPQFGSVAMMLDLEPGRGLKDAFEKPDRVDALFLDRVMTKYSKHLAVLAAEEPLEEMITPSEAAVTALLNHLRAKFSVLVVDLPARLSPVARMVLAQADPVLLVSELSMHDLRDVMRISDYFRGALKAKPPTVIASRVGVGGKHELAIAEFEKGFGGKVAFKVPNSPEAFAALATGKVLAESAKDSPAAKALREIARTLNTQESAESAHAGKAGLLSKLFKKPA